MKPNVLGGLGNGNGSVGADSKVLLRNSIEFNDVKDLDTLIEDIGDAQYVLLGEATHGTHEYYSIRAQITMKLIEKKGFSFIAVEGDWPDSYTLNRYVKNLPFSGKHAFNILNQFNRWPTWMWANWEVVALAEWLKTHNAGFPQNRKVGFYGLDVYSLWESMEAIIHYLKKVDTQALEVAMKAFRCFEPYYENEGRAYAHAASSGPISCEREVIDLLMEIRNKSTHYNTDHDAVFSAQQNAQVIVNAEKYYRTMIKGGVEAWNIRDKHMMDTLNRLVQFYGRDSKVIIWGHNSHIGDARATEMASEGQVNLGQLIREQHGDQRVYAVGFGSNTGHVVAGRNWGDVMRVMHIPPALKGSWEYIQHGLGAKDRITFMTDEMKQKFEHAAFGHRAIGVVYHTQYEQYGNYIPSMITRRYDAFIYIDTTTALHPLHIEPDGQQVPGTYPFGF